MRRLVLLVLAVALVVGAAPAVAAAEPCPPFDGGQSFLPIDSIEGPEEFCWEVSLEEDQELRQIDDRHAGVYWVPDEVLAMHIDAPAAHDAEGKSVPTTIAVSGENLITLTVHHRAGNPAAGGSPFQYPITAGAGWEGGFQTHHVEGPPPVTPPTPTVPTVEVTTYCVVPALRGKSRRAAARALRLAHCELGPVRGENSHGAKVVRQYRQAGTLFAAGTAVGIKLAP